LYSRTAVIVFLILLGSALVIGQDVPEIKKRQEEERKKEKPERKSTAPADTTGRKRSEAAGDFAKAEKDTSKLIPVKSNLYWYDLENHLSLKSDTSRFTIYQSADEKRLIYKDMSDIFADQLLWTDFDLAEAGRPGYISSTNLYPHQTNFYYNNILMNESVQGMFNTQFIPVNNTQAIEVDQVRGNRRNFAAGGAAEIDVTSSSEQFQEPWTKILYKQGSYGYSDLDVNLAIPFSPTLAVQLGGTNRYFDGTIPDAGFRGVNYRGEITWQFSPVLYFRTQIFLNRIKAGMASFDYSQKIFRSSNEENRDDIFFDMTWLQNDSTGQRLHILLTHTFYWRKFRSIYSSYTFETKSIRYGVDANYNLFVGPTELLLGAGALFPQVLGDPFKDNPTFPSFNAYARWRIPLTDQFILRTDAQALQVKDLEPQVIPAAGLDYFISEKNFASFDISAGKRLPNATERFWDFDTLYGNIHLIPEEYLTVQARYRYREENVWQLGFETGYHQINNEIIWQEPQFENSGARDFYYLSTEAGLKVWKFTIGFGGKFAMADIHLTPRESAWGSLHFQDSFLSRALIVDAYGTVLYQGGHQDIIYQSQLDRFYPGTEQTDAFFTLNWKIVATIHNAQIFLEMDNALSADYQVIFGYLNYLRLFRFGLNWVLWD
jgi:hypothetical protein